MVGWHAGSGWTTPALRRPDDALARWPVTARLVCASESLTS